MTPRANLFYETLSKDSSSRRSCLLAGGKVPTCLLPSHYLPFSVTGRRSSQLSHMGQGIILSNLSNVVLFFFTSSTSPNPTFFFFCLSDNSTSVWEWELESDYDFTCRIELAVWSRGKHFFYKGPEGTYLGFAGYMVSVTLFNTGTVVWRHPGQYVTNRHGYVQWSSPDTDSELDWTHGCDVPTSGLAQHFRGHVLWLGLCKASLPCTNKSVGGSLKNQIKSDFLSHIDNEE